MSALGNVILLLIGALIGGLFLSAITSPNTFDLATFLFGAVCGACVVGLAIVDDMEDVMATTATDRDLDSALSVIRELFINSLCSCGGWKCPRCLVTVQEAKELLPVCPVCNGCGQITDEVKCDACSGLGICLYDSIDMERLKEEGRV